MTASPQTDPRPSKTAASPRIADHILSEHPVATQPPELHTAAELSAMIALLHIAQASTITIGHGRYDTSSTTATAIAAAWADSGGRVVDIVDWPAVAASWLRPARRLIQGQPDAWVIADTPAGFAQLARRLGNGPGWTATRTFGSASLDSQDLIQLAGPTVVSGLSGANRNGGTWRFVHGMRLHARPRNVISG